MRHAFNNIRSSLVGSPSFKLVLNHNFTAALHSIQNKMKQVKATFALVIIATFFMSLSTVSATSRFLGQGGCYKGYCWAGTSQTVFSGWCYTTSEGVSRNCKYVQCTQDAECSPDWKCAGPC